MHFYMHPYLHKKNYSCKKWVLQRSNVATLIKSKRNEVARINLVQAQVEKCILYFILSIGRPLYQEGYHMDCQ
jgi:hypothetical protein